MSSLIYRIARACYRARLRVVAAWLALVALFAVLTVTMGGTFDDDFTIPGASSQVALDQLKMTFPEAAYSAATVVVLAPPGKTIEDPDIEKALEASAKEFEKIPWVALVQLPNDPYIEGLMSDDKTAGYMSVRVKDLTVSTMTDAQREELTELSKQLEASIPGSEVHIGGDLFAVNMPKITVVELIGVGVAIIVLIAVLGSFQAAMMPIASALVGAGLSLMLIIISAGIVTINSTTMILALMLALAVGIDYSLFIVSRHRDQLATGMDAEESAARATATAGSAVVFAGLTVIVALVGLAVAGLPFLTIMGVFAAVAVAIEVALALTFLPAMLGFAGERLRPKPSKKPKKIGDGGPSRWWVGVITKAPAVTILVVVVLLGVLSIPTKDLQLALPNSGRNVPGAPDRITFDLISDRFGVGYNGPLVITGTIVESDDPMGIIDGVVADVEAMPGVKLVAMAVPNPNVDTALIQIIPETGPDDPATADLVHALRDKAPEWEERLGIKTAVTGFTAAAIDVSSRLAEALLPFGIFVVGLSLVLLTMVFRSIWVPVKAALGYLLSVGAAFGATALVFNMGWFKEVINLPEPLPVISFLPIILMGILFGLAMDYEVFLTSRMREEFVHGNEETPTEDGFVHSAKVVVAAAIIMFAVFAFFVPSGEGVIKPIAFGLALGVAMDAFLVRMTLGPAVMKLLGSRAWWLPKWLDRRMPIMDVEGEALSHQLALADWPYPDAPQSVYAEGLGAMLNGVTWFKDVDVDLSPGDTLLVAGPTAPRSALLLALSGRLRLTSGEIKVLGYAIPEESGLLRKEAAYVVGDSPQTTQVLNHGAQLVVVDDADQLQQPELEQLGRMAAEAPETQTTLIVGVTHIPSVRPLLPKQAKVLDLTEAKSPTGGLR